MQHSTALLLATSLVLVFSCKNDPGVMCTEEYRMLTVTVRDSASRPVLLNHYSVKKLSTGQIIDFSSEDPWLDSINRSQGIYFLLTDGQMWMTSTSGAEFEFSGWSHTSQMVNETYLIGNDRCHVQLLTGQTNIIVSK